jgi:heme/copper-type cytochrome/quinol oxidase subunit 4
LSNTNNALALAFGVVMVMLIIASSLWLVTHSNYNIRRMHQ